MQQIGRNVFTIVSLFITNLFFFLSFIFVRHLAQSNYITAKEYAQYEYLASQVLVNLFGDYLDKFEFRFVSDKSTIDTCIERIRKRNRPGEEKITRDYLESLEQLHESFFASLAENFKINVYFKRIE